MKKQTKIKAICGLLFNAVMGLFIAFALGCMPVMGAVAAVGGSLALGRFMPNGVAAGVFTEIWTGELVTKLRAGTTATWLDGISDYSTMAANDIIHLVDVGADPDVLINNTTYPIPIQDLPDNDIAISLDKYQTKATRVTDDELYAISYNKMASVKERHGESILENKFKKAIHALAPQSNAAKTPVITTTGANDNGRRRLTRKDVIILKDKFDKMEIPTEGRRLVLCTDHVQDLLLDDQKFADQYYNYTSGKIANMYGFEVYEYVSNPYFTSVGAKKAFGATPGANEYQASVAFSTKRAFKASGSTKMYYSEAAKSPTTQENLINFRHYFIVLPKKQEAIAAIVSSVYSASIAVDPGTLTFDVAGGIKQVAVSASSDFVVSGSYEGFTVVKDGSVLTVTAADNTAGASAKEGTITVTLTEDITKTATITLAQPKAA